MRSIRSIVLYEPPSGSTEKIARAISRGLQLHLGPVECQNITDANAERLCEYDLIAVGSPTKSFRASKSMVGFLQGLEGKNLTGKYGFAFDTKPSSWFPFSASRSMNSKLRKLGLQTLVHHQS